MGGIAGMALGLAGWFVEQKGLRLGTLSTRDTSVSFVLNPRPTTYGGPLAILVDGCTGSTAEIFSGGMKDIKRAFDPAGILNPGKIFP
jgi:C-terminal processing protease CtpA/Prc